MECVHQYQDLGYAVFPCDQNTKRARVKWRNLTVEDSRGIKWRDGDLIGLVVPQGAIVLDLDIKESVDGMANMTGMTPIWEHYVWDVARSVAITGSGGMHLWFRCPDRLHWLGTSTGGLPAGVDVRANSKGYVVAPPSRHPNGRQYVWDPGRELVPVEDLGELPEWIIDLFTEDMNCDVDPGPQIDVEDLAGLLDQIPPEEYEGNDNWFPIMCAAYNCTDGAGKDLFLRWWVRVPRADPDDPEIERRWDSLGSSVNNSRRTVATLIDAVNKHGGDCLELVSKIRREGAVDLLEADPLPELDTVHEHKPMITIGTDIKAMREKATLALAESGSVFQRGGQLVEVDVMATANTKRNEPLVGSLVVNQITPAVLTEILADKARWVKMNKTGPAPTDPSKKVVDAILGRCSFRVGDQDIPVVDGLARSPFMRADGSICAEPGYDRDSACFYRPDTEFPEIPAAPSSSDAARALGELHDVFRDYPFLSDADRDIAVAAVLTILGRSMFGDVPIFTFDAAQASTGKSHCCDTISLIATGQGVSKFTFPGRSEELEKILGSVALQAPVAMCFDNIDTKLRGTALDKVVTSNQLVDFRVLGRTEIYKARWRTVVLANGNNLHVAGDTITRTLPCRMESDLERPEQRRDFVRPDLHGWIREHRGSLVRAALVVLRAWVCAGRPQVVEAKLTRFAEWNRIIPQAIVFAGGVDPTIKVEDLGSDIDDEYEPLAELYTALIEKYPGGFLVKNLVGESGIGDDDLIDPTLRSLVPEMTPGKVSALFRRMKGRIIRRMRLINSVDPVVGGRNKKWKIIELKPAQ